MLLADALRLVKRLILTGEKHRDYDHTVQLAETYKIFITGKNIGKKLIQFVQREDKELFEQRLRLTKSITPAVASSIRQPFNKVTRNDRVRKNIELKNEARRPIVEEMAKRFYGSKRKQNGGLEYWLKTRFTELQFIDPNSWAVIEWDAPDDPGKVISPRPFEVSAAQAHNFFIDNDEVKWLFVCQGIKFKTVNPAATGGTGTSTNAIPLNPAAGTGEPETKDGSRFTLYDEDFTIVFEQIDPAYLKSIGYTLNKNESLEKIKETDYLIKVYEPKVGYVPAFRIGYKRDEETCGRTYVNPWHDGLCFFEKSLKTVSELDLTMTLHTFPQKLQYVQKCKGRIDNGKFKGCNNGYEQGTANVLCGTCKGTGYKVHTTAQDAILLPMPDTAQDMINLDQILVYKAPPTELVKLQNEYCLQLERQAHQAVFNSQVFVKKAGGGITEQQTATEADFNMQSVYDALEPFTEKFSEMWRELVTIFAVISGETLDKITVSHDFPADYKLKTGDILLSERKAAKDSGAPTFLIETIDDDLATIIYAGDELGLQKYRVKRRFYPFTGKNEDEVNLLLASEHVPLAPKVLYSNFELIFKEIEQAKPEFWFMKDLKVQRQLVEEKTAEWIEKVKADKPAAILPFFRPGAEEQKEEGTEETAE